MNFVKRLPDIIYYYTRIIRIVPEPRDLNENVVCAYYFFISFYIHP